MKLCGHCSHPNVGLDFCTRCGLKTAWDKPKKAGALTATLKEIEDTYVQMVLKSVDDNKYQAAKILGMHYTTLYRKFVNPKPKIVLGPLHKVKVKTATERQAEIDRGYEDVVDSIIEAAERARLERLTT